MDAGEMDPNSWVDSADALWTFDSRQRHGNIGRQQGASQSLHCAAVWQWLTIMPMC